MKWNPLGYSGPPPSPVVLQPAAGDSRFGSMRWLIDGLAVSAVTAASLLWDFFLLVVVFPVAAVIAVVLVAYSAAKEKVKGSP